MTTYRMNVVGRVVLLVSSVVLIASGFIFLIGPGPVVQRISSLAGAVALAAAVLKVWTCRMEVRSDGVLVRNPLGTTFVPWSEFDDFLIRRWWHYPRTLFVQRKDGSLVHVFVRALGVASDPHSVKEDLFRLQHLARDLGRSS